jgi:hypothetical protein
MTTTNTSIPTHNNFGTPKHTHGATATAMLPPTNIEDTNLLSCVSNEALARLVLLERIQQLRTR